MIGGGNDDEAEAEAEAAGIPIPSIPADGGGVAGGAVASAAPVASAAVPAPVPDVILSLVKDARYTGYLAELFADAVGPWLPRRSSSSGSNGDGNVAALLGPELNLLATLCHWALVRWRSGEGKSLGMDALGLSYDYVARPRARAGEDLVSSSPNPPSTGTGAGGSVSSSSSLADTFGGSGTMAALFASSHVLVPYLLRRALRGGWGRDLADFLAATTRDRGGAGAATGSPSSPSAHRQRGRGGAGADSDGGVAADVGDGGARGVEGLRGSARLVAHEERRRRMIRRGASAGGDGDGDGGGPADGGVDVVVVVEAEAEAGAGAATPVVEATSSPPPPPRGVRLCGRARDAAWSLLQKVALATDGNDLAATTTVGSNRGGGGGVDDATEERSEAALATANAGRFRAATIEALRWAARLHVALFLLNGKYKSFIDRAFRVRLRQRSDDGGGGGTTTSRPSYGLVGALILLEVCASVAKASAVAAVDASEVLRALLRRHRHRRRRRRLVGTRNCGEGHDEDIRGSSTGDGGGGTGHGSDEAVGDHSAASALEERVPSMGMSSMESPSPPSTSSPMPAPTCGICMGRRGSPAGAPTTCGHVFCWGCIQRWMDGGVGGAGVRRREWCPTCRTPCRPQDVLALYHF